MGRAPYKRSAQVFSTIQRLASSVNLMGVQAATTFVVAKLALRTDTHPCLCRWDKLEAVPLDAIMISGSQTIEVHYWASIGAGRWKTIGTGDGWGGDKLFSIVQNHINHRRPVFIDADPRWWLPCSWQRDEILLIVELEKHFSFRHVKDTIYEISWKGDPVARGDPNLSGLLPENRTEDTKKCLPL